MKYILRIAWGDLEHCGTLYAPDPKSALALLSYFEDHGFWVAIYDLENGEIDGWELLNEIDALENE